MTVFSSDKRKVMRGYDNTSKVSEVVGYYINIIVKIK